MLKVTVLMSIYNGERYLRDAVDSILGQTVSPFEFIIVDDGSQDHTWSILNDYAARDRRVRLVRNAENTGLTCSLNRALRLARGEYVARMDADDLSLPERLEKQLETIVVSGADICFCHSVYLDELNGRESVWREADWPLTRWRGLFENRYGLHPAAMFRRRSVLDVGAYDESFPRAQDYELWDRCAAEGLRFAYTRTLLLRYRLRSQGISRQHLDEQERGARRVSFRAMRRLVPDASDAELQGIRWLFLRREYPPAGRPGAGLRHCRGLLEQFQRQHAADGGLSSVWRDVASHLCYRLAALGSADERRQVLPLIWHALLRSRSPRGVLGALRQCARGLTLRMKSYWSSQR